jgi:hypothetical protein
MPKNYKILTENEIINLIYDEMEEFIDRMENKTGVKIRYNFTVDRVKKVDKIKKTK